MVRSSELMVSDSEVERLRTASRDWKSLTLTPRQQCDLELLMNGGFSPLKGFLSKADYESVLSSMRLSTGELWPIPINLDVSEEFAEQVEAGEKIALRSIEGVLLAVLTVNDLWRPDFSIEAMQVFGTTDQAHPGVDFLFNNINPVYLGGSIEGVELPTYYDFKGIRLTPAQLRERFKLAGVRKVVAFQTRNPMHRAHFELTRRAAEEIGGVVLIHPVVGLTKPGDVDYFTRVRCYKAITRRYPEAKAYLSLLPLAMRMAGPREALWHALIRKNYGATHFIVGRDHAGPGVDSSGEPFYGPYEAQELLKEHSPEIGVEMVPFKFVQYVAEKNDYLPADEITEDMTTRSISGTELREHLRKGIKLPDWFTFPEVAEELYRTFKPREKQGICVFFTGLPSAGKSTLANVLQTRLLEIGGRPVTLLDGDIVRTHLSSELGFSKEHRDLNIRRIGYVASEIVKNGGVAICAPIAPYDQVRKEVRNMNSHLGGFVLVHVATPLAVCEQRDRKGLYAKARAGIIDSFTGISDPYEEPQDAELVLNTASLTAEEAVARVVEYLRVEGYIE